MNKLLIIDFYNLMHRAYHAYPRELATSSGEQTNAVFGFTNILLNAINYIKPTHIIVATETDRSFRQKEFPDYKENRTWRKDNPDQAKEFDQQVPRVYEIIKTMKIPILKAKNFEADDIIGTIGKKFEIENPKFEIIILSSDQDLLQLIKGTIKVFRPARPPYTKAKLFSKKDVYEKFGFDPKYIPDYKALKGDPSDNIPGVKGIGEKNAKKLIMRFCTIKEIYKNLEQITPSSLRKKIKEGKKSADLSKRLTTIIINVPLNFNIKKSKIENLNTSKTVNLFRELEFKSLIKKLTEKESVKGQETNNPQLKLI